MQYCSLFKKNLLGWIRDNLEVPKDFLLEKEKEIDSCHLFIYSEKLVLKKQTAGEGQFRWGCGGSDGGAIQWKPENATSHRRGSLQACWVHENVSLRSFRDSLQILTCKHVQCPTTEFLDHI